MKFLTEVLFCYNENRCSDIGYAGLGSTEYDPAIHDNIYYMIPSEIMKVNVENLVYGIIQKGF